MHFYPNFEIFKIVFGLVICFGVLLCKFVNYGSFGESFSSFQFSVLTENGNFQLFLKLFPQRFLVLSHTLSNSFRQCKFKNVGL